jgi:hypothetical protein
VFSCLDFVFFFFGLGAVAQGFARTPAMNNAFFSSNKVGEEAQMPIDGREGKKSKKDGWMDMHACV